MQVAIQLNVYIKQEKPYKELLGLLSQAVIDAEIFPILVGFFCHHHADSDFDIKKEVVWAITNATRRGSADQIMYIWFTITFYFPLS